MVIRILTTAMGTVWIVVSRAESEVHYGIFHLPVPCV